MEETLFTLSRAMPFLESGWSASLPPEIRSRLDRIGRDVQSLSSHESRLSDKMQFLLDASLGLIGIEQNDIFKVLTIVSVIGIPPTLIASMYGMNFKNMPEYRLGLGLPLRPDLDRRQRAAAAVVVQVAEMVERCFPGRPRWRRLGCSILPRQAA